MNFKEIIHILQLGQKTIATMESCTGGGVVNAITNCEGASEVLKYSAVTYSNEYKVKMGVPKEVIDKYIIISFTLVNILIQKFINNEITKTFKANLKSFFDEKIQ